MRFSQRQGIRKIQEWIQTDSMTEELRNSLWNVLSLYKFSTYSFLVGEEAWISPPVNSFLDSLWIDFFKEPIDTKHSDAEKALRTVRNRYFSWEWDEVYDFVEFNVQYFSEKELTEQINSMLERELSGYRFVKNILTPIIESSELEMLDKALSDEIFPGVQTHLQRALELLSDRKNPDHRNSIKESISAVESIASLLANKKKATLSEALKILKKKNNLHPALEEGFNKIYGYTYDGDGIRHAMLEEPNLSFADSIYFLISCTAFINYLKSKMS